MSSTPPPPPPPPPYPFPPSPNHKNNNNKNDFLSNFPPELIHRILLTDPQQLSQLTISGKPRRSSSYTFEQFLIDHCLYQRQQQHLTTTPPQQPPCNVVTDQITQTMRKAYFDSLKDEITSQTTLDASYTKAISELYTSIKRLIPHRTDLHGILESDDDIRSQIVFQNESTYLPPLIRAGEALTALEAPDQVDATREWIALARGWCSSRSNDDDDDDDDKKLSNPYGLDGLTLAMASVSYLSLKVEQCHDDIANYKLVAMAPNIQEYGVAYERRTFQELYGSFDDKDVVAPATKQWMRRIVVSSQHSRESLDELRTCREKRVMTIQQIGFVQDLLFSQNDDNDDDDDDDGDDGGGGGGRCHIKLLPEVLLQDVESLTELRHIAKMTVIGSALALHVCTLTRTADTVLKSDPLPPHLNVERLNLVKAMAKGIGVDGGLTKEISDAVLGLARAMKPSIDTEIETSILNRTNAVLQNKDPVLQLLDSRVRQLFQTMIVKPLPSSSPQHTAPLFVAMKTGRSKTTTTTTPIQPSEMSSLSFPSKQFMNDAKQEACNNGFAFYAHDLAMGCHLARKVVNLMLDVFGDFLDRLFVEECCRSSSSSTSSRCD